MDLLAQAQWVCTAVEPGSVGHPDELDALDQWLPVSVPGTAAGAIRDANGVDAARQAQTDASDWWFVTDVPARGRGPWRLSFDGLATEAEIWVGSQRVAVSESMFVPLVVVLDELPGSARIALRFPSLDAALKTRRPRGRWRSSLISAQGLRWFRTTLIGRAPVFGGVPAPVGPWRPVRLLDGTDPVTISRRVHTHLDGSDGVVEIEVVLAGPAVTSALVTVDEQEARAEIVSRQDRSQLVRARAVVPKARLWWPHTHGQPAGYSVDLHLDGKALHLGSAGFRSVTADYDDNRFALQVNGIDVFCRGIVWTPSDPIGLNTPREARRVLERCVDAGINMIRIPGTTVYERDDFYSDCAELGIMVWQDVMLATTDPPDDVGFRTLLEEELRSFALRHSGNPALVVLCGGSETEQQPAMLGVQRAVIPAIDDVLPAIADAVAPGVVWVSSSPSAPPGSDALPIDVSSGVAHYFGVGGYRRPLSDVRAAGVRFAAECLAFSIPPGNDAVEAAFGSVAVAGHHPAWKAAVPRDNGASWDFEDVRDHYVRSLFGADPAAERWSDPERYLDLGRAAVCEAFTEVLQHWRRPDSGCRGALVLAARDLEPGAGWGVLDHAGVPKAPWFVLRRVFAPVTALLVDDGLDGLRVLVFNDTDRPLAATLHLRSHTAAGVVSTDITVPLTLAAHDAHILSWNVVTGGFADVNHAYRFGTKAFDAASVRLVDASGVVLAENVHLIGGAARPVERNIGLRATAHRSANGWSVTVDTDGAAQYVRLNVAGFDATDSWFHLPPGGSRTVPLRPAGLADRPTGRVAALNSAVTAPICAGDGR
ncbi:glycoside hydrolase family 2 protein [Rhodococcus sp. 105337]|uniref:glycosyl hydrolase 2 galactose-binding domain-containing protein n=1 Tax=Rhodococcus sp. 105337 TaxID=2725310 RepID=UPI00146E736A|nr:glycoside hydrolase family 2 protein [Rhodococcus sp. 105337]NME80651.1 glycosyl hydrolase [Rhodococcus sp. 105337]